MLLPAWNAMRYRAVRDILLFGCLLVGRWNEILSIDCASRRRRCGRRFHRLEQVKTMRRGDARDARCEDRAPRAGAREAHAGVTPEKGKRSTIRKELTLVWGTLKVAKRAGKFPSDIDSVMPVEWSNDYDPRALKLIEAAPFLRYLAARAKIDAGATSGRTWARRGTRWTRPRSPRSRSP